MNRRSFIRSCAGIVFGTIIKVYCPLPTGAKFMPEDVGPPVNLKTVDKILKEVYLPVIREQMNRSTVILDRLHDQDGSDH